MHSRIVVLMSEGTHGGIGVGGSAFLEQGAKECLYSPLRFMLQPPGRGAGRGGSHGGVLVSGEGDKEWRIGG
mgnify:CR=1 FL=1